MLTCLILSAEEFNQVKDDITAEIELHHETNAKNQEDVLKAVKTATKQYYAEKGISVSSAWYDWKYKYTGNIDFFTLSTHLDYMDSEKKNHINIEWNTDELMIGTREGIKTFTFRKSQ